MTETHNPYAAPVAAVADVAPPVSLPPLHPHVKRACTILWWSLALSLVAVPIEMMRQSRILGTDANLIALAIGGVIGLMLAVAITWWITAKLRAGRNWMRWLLNIFAALSVVGIPLIWAAYPSVYADMLARPADIALSVAQYALNIASLVLINTRSSRAWFAAMKRPPH